MVTVLGRTFNPEALKQPRGFMRLLQCFFAMLAFSCCAGFGSSLSFKITCTDAGDNSSTITETVKADYSYPFALDKIDPHTLDICGIGESKVYFPGDFGSDAKFFVFIGVICWLYAILSLLVYTFMADVYEEEQKKLSHLRSSDFRLFCVFLAGVQLCLGARSQWFEVIWGP